MPVLKDFKSVNYVGVNGQLFQFFSGLFFPKDPAYKHPLTITKSCVTNIDPSSNSFNFLGQCFPDAILFHRTSGESNFFHIGSVMYPSKDSPNQHSNNNA